MMSDRDITLALILINSLYCHIKLETINLKFIRKTLRGDKGESGLTMTPRTFFLMSVLSCSKKQEHCCTDLS